MGPTAERTLHVVGNAGEPSALTYDGAVLRVGRGGRQLLQVPLRRVLWAAAVGATVEVSVLSYKKTGRKGPPALALVNVSANINAVDVDAAPAWAADLMQAAYDGVKRQRRLRVLVNPAGGSGKARHIFMHKVEPILRAARCELDVTYTTHRNHAQEIAQALPLVYDAVVCVSGDGLLHEVYNGLAQHATPTRALRTPLAPVPAGSGNGTILNLLGLEQGIDIGAAALNALKGVPTALDLFALSTPGQAPTYTFMSQALGLVADMDIGTEAFRWMGDTRFYLGFLRGLIANAACPVRVAIKVAEADKRAMVRACDAARAQAAPAVDDAEPETEALPALQYDFKSSDGWIEFERPLLYFYAGQGPYVGRDLMQFPVSLANDGLIDIAICENASRADILRGMDGGEKGAPFWLPLMHYFKAHAYRVTPATPGAKVCLSVDGEAYPFGAFQVEVHPGVARILSPEGRYMPVFTLPAPANTA